MKHLNLLLVVTLILANSYSFSQGSGNCLDFDGLNDYVSVPDHASIEPEIITVECWFFASLPAQGSALVSKFQNSNSGFFIEYQGGRIRLMIGNNVPAASIFTPNGSVSANEWTHVAITRDASNNANVYINGELSVTGTLSGSIASIRNLTIGRNANDPADYHFGMIDEVRIWNRALAQNEIKDNMCLQLNGNESGLVGYWAMDEGVGNTVNDLTSNANHGTRL